MTEFIRPPQAAVLYAAGINRDIATKRAVELAGGRAEIVHVTELAKNIAEYAVVIVPGGFSYGDDIQSGRGLAVELQTQLADQLLEHANKGRLIFGACNGFQVLLQTGLLPFCEMLELQNIKATLDVNGSGVFESRSILIKPQESVCGFIPEDGPLSVPVAHGEGRFTASPEILSLLESQGQIVYRYCDAKGLPAEDYPANPNGSVNQIAGICDRKGRIVGMMPHWEDNTKFFHDPNWRRSQIRPEPPGKIFYRNLVAFAKDI